MIGFISRVPSSLRIYTPEAERDKIENLPGTQNLELLFNQFSGYLKIGPKKTKKIHYWFVESQGNSTVDPLAFWTNGGPGCSGLLGLFTEQGPFRPNRDKTLSLNEYSWNKVANMVFIESPCGVGFSYSLDTNRDYSNNDAQTAQDNYELIQEFLKRFPEYEKNPLYISSESYGGHYLPTWAKKIVTENDKLKNMSSNSSADNGFPRVLNFKGFAVGNPYTNLYSGTGAMLETFWGRQLIPKSLWDSYYSRWPDGCGVEVLILIALIRVLSMKYVFRVLLTLILTVAQTFTAFTLFIYVLACTYVRMYVSHPTCVAFGLPPFATDLSYTIWASDTHQ